MASNKRKQDERHLKMLREMVGLPNNKQCFDCHQKGPTYIDMTNGSYVCTSCSGILRGLNPPHRVKSISMASFSGDEMEFMKTHGNDFSRKVWLGLYDTRSMSEPDSREEQKVKDFMVQKYEKKRWYVAPTEGMKDEARHQNELALANLNTKSTRPLKSMLGSDHSPKLSVPGHQHTSHPNSVPPPVTAQRIVNAQSHPGPPPGQPPSLAPATQHPLTQPSAQPPRQSATMDLLGDLGGDPFASNHGNPVTAPPPPVQSTAPSGGGFADFANFNNQPMSTPAFPTTSAPLQPLGSVPNQTAAPAANISSGFGAFGAQQTTSQPQSIGGGDKYAAFADLSGVFSSSPSGGGATQTSVPAPTGSGAVNWSGGSGGAVSWGGGAPGGGGTGAVNWNNPGSTTPSGGTTGLGWNTSSAQTTTTTNVFSNSNTAANPFGARPAVPQQQQPPPQMAGNPFGGGGGGAGGFAQFPSNPPTHQQGGFSQFGMASQPPATAANHGGFGQMQNGGFGMMPAGNASAPGGFAFQQGAQAPGIMAGAQFGKPGGFGAPTQPFGGAGAGGWGNPQAIPPSNPFMSAATQQAPPRTNATNPFL